MRPLYPVLLHTSHASTSLGSCRERHLLRDALKRILRMCDDVAVTRGLRCAVPRLRSGVVGYFRRATGGGGCVHPVSRAQAAGTPRGPAHGSRKHIDTVFPTAICVVGHQTLRYHEQVYPPAYTWDFVHDERDDAGVMGDDCAPNFDDRSEYLYSSRIQTHGDGESCSVTAVDAGSNVRPKRASSVGAVAPDRYRER
jgi:hypothetical protein